MFTRLNSVVSQIMSCWILRCNRIREVHPSLMTKIWCVCSWLKVVLVIVLRGSDLIPVITFF